MVFGALVGGMIGRAGERGYEAAERKRNEELYKQKIQLDFLTSDLQQNWDTYDENDRAVRYGMIEPLAGMKTGQLGQFAKFGEQVYKILPPAPTQGTAPATTPRTQQAVAGETQPALPSAMSPAFRTRAGQQIEPTAAPAMPEISIGEIPQIPTSAETAQSGAVPWAGPTQPGQTINYSQVPGERRLQMKQRYDEEARAREIAEIGVAPIPEHLKQAGVAKQYGVNAVPIITSEIGAGSRENIAHQRFMIEAQKLNSFYGQPSIVKRGEENIFTWQTKSGAVTVLPDGQTVKFVPQPGDSLAPPVSQGRGSDFAQYVQRMEGELGRSLTAAEVQQARNRFPDAPYTIKTKVNGQDVEVITSRSNILGAGRAPGAKGKRKGALAATSPQAPKTGAGTTSAAQPTTPQFGQVPNVGGLVFPSQTSNAEDKMGDDHEQAYHKVIAVDQTVNSEFLGAVRGGTIDYTLRAKFPELTQFFGRPGIPLQESVFRAMHESMRNSTIHLLSGAAVSPTEQVRIMGELPDPSRPGDWEGRVLKTKHNAAFLLNRIRQRQGQPGVAVPVLPTGAEAPGASGSSSWSPEKRARYEEWKRKQAEGR